MRKLIVFVLSIMMISACVTVNKLGVSNLSYLYQGESNFADVRFVPFHTSEAVSRVYFKLELSGLLYEEPEPDADYQARFKISYQLYQGFTTHTLIDSGSVVYNDALFFGASMPFSSSFDVKTVYPGEFVLNLALTDLNADNTYTTYLELSKQSGYSRQNFLILNEFGGVIFDEFPAVSNDFRLRYNDSLSTNLSVRYYNRDFPIAVPPNIIDKRISFDYEADSMFDVKLVNGQTPVLHLKEKGFYHFQIDTSVREGVTMFKFLKGFPEVITPGQMLEPLQYLTSRKEFDDLRSNENPKTAVEEFWLNNAGHVERARKMIQRYYLRVQDANRYFTSYLDGWKTDRGIIYIIYGKPNVVYKNDNLERWIYGEEGNIMSITFDFLKVENPFTNNDYLLTKSPTYKESWYMAVNNWRR